MDDQAEKLRQLVRNVRHAATTASRPLSAVLYAGSPSPLADQFYQQLNTQLAERGVTENSFDLRQLSGPYSAEQIDHWQRASLMVVFVVDQQQSIVDCYATLKRVQEYTPLPAIELLVAATNGTEQAWQTAERFLQTCQRFLLCSASRSSIVDPSEASQADAVESLIDRMLEIVPCHSEKGHAEMDHSPIALIGR